MSEAKTESQPGQDELLPLSELAKQLPCVRGNKPPNRATLYKWATIGLLDRAGNRVQLPTRFVGGTRCASLADVEAFFDAKKDYSPRSANTPMTQTEKTAMRRRGKAASDWLARRGF